MIVEVQTHVDHLPGRGDRRQQVGLVGSQETAVKARACQKLNRQLEQGQVGVPLLQHFQHGPQPRVRCHLGIAHSPVVVDGLVYLHHALVEHERHVLSIDVPIRGEREALSGSFVHVRASP